ncbi:MAG: hypothetical protein JWM87_206 [Candidatus Eremiobacteraeota bacterium]|nr:hypothetical protein [Candidatus Eremiobacteraeota bacterium]
MNTKLPARFWIETVLGIVSAGCLALTLVRPQWIEIFGIEPDGGDGSAEWRIALALVVATAALFTLARREWRKRAS